MDLDLKTCNICRKNVKSYEFNDAEKMCLDCHQTFTNEKQKVTNNLTQRCINCY